MRKALPWLVGGSALLAALALNYWTGTYVDRIGPALAPARDFLFDRLPFAVFPLVHGWGFVGFLAVFGAGAWLDGRGRRVPFYLWAYALIIAARAVFTVLTPLGVPAEAPTFEHYSLRGVFQYFDFRHTFFFSGHTAFPFTGFLIAGQRWVRLACLGFSLLLASSVLLSRLHYSIDVFAAFFIAYAVADLSRKSWTRLGFEADRP
ncbi:MAG: hypothetical protein M0D55_03640 [Elusimicrobiota bacterium]|nr:MAG: hypothetical protein M0D55_03640 [Elusimicrobiota bacterium]